MTKILCLAVAVWCLVIAGAHFQAYSIYQGSRWLVFGAAISVASQSPRFWIVPFGLLAVIFNPVIPLRLDRGTWQILDIVAAFIFLVRCPFKP